MISSEHHRRDISSASISTGFLLEFQPLSWKGEAKGGDCSCPFLLCEESCGEEGFSGNREGCPCVAFREREKWENSGHHSIAELCLAACLGQRSAENKDLGLLIIPVRFCLSTQPHFPVGCAEHYLPVILCIQALASLANLFRVQQAWTSNDCWSCAEFSGFSSSWEWGNESEQGRECPFPIHHCLRGMEGQGGEEWSRNSVCHLSLALDTCWQQGWDRHKK